MTWKTGQEARKSKTREVTESEIKDDLVRRWGEEVNQIQGIGFDSNENRVIFYNAGSFVKAQPNQTKNDFQVLPQRVDEAIENRPESWE